MAVKRGTDGLIEVSDDSGTTWLIVASQQSWAIDQSNETIDTTVLGAQRVRSNITTFLAWSATCDGFWDDEDQTAALAQGIIQAHVEDGTELDIRITPSATGGAPEVTGDYSYYGTANVANANPSGGFDTAVQISLSFEGTGALTYEPFPV